MSTRIFIGGLPTKAEAKNLEKKFGKYGDILSVDIKDNKDIDGNTISKFAYINLAAETSQVLECINFFNGASWKGSELKVELAKESFLDKLKRERENAKRGIADNPEIGSVKQNNVNENSSMGERNSNKKNNFQINEENKYYELNKQNNDDWSRAGNKLNNNWSNDDHNNDYGKGNRNIYENNDLSRNENYTDSGGNKYNNDWSRNEDIADDEENKYNNEDHKSYGGNKYNRFKDSNEYDSKNNRRQNYHQYEREVPKPVEMIRYDPTMPNIVNVNKTKVKIAENVDSNINSKEIKVEIFGKLNFSDTTFNLSNTLDGKESKKSLPQKDTTPKSVNFFIKPDDPRLKEAANEFIRKLSDKERRDLENVKVSLLTEHLKSIKTKRTYKKKNNKRLK